MSDNFLKIFFLGIFVVSCSRTYFPTPDSQGGWRTITSEDEIQKIAGMDKSKLEEAFEFIKGSTKNGGLLVVRHGWLVYESYFGLSSPETAPNLASCGKSVTSIAIGILMAEHPELFPDGLDQKIFTPTYFPSEAFPLTDAAKADIKLGQLLAFSAGIRGNNPCYVEGKETIIDPPGPDGWFSVVDSIALGLVDFRNNSGQVFSARTLWCTPGGGYSYATSSIHLASIMLRYITGMELQDYINQKLAEPLGWEHWNYGYRNYPRLTHTPGGGGICLRGTDMLRFGYLLLQGGHWQGEQLIPEEYVRLCSQKSPYNPHFPYSLQFNVNTDGQVTQFPRDTFWKSGSGGHCLYVVPSLDLVVWKLGGRDGQYHPRNTGLPLPTEDKYGKHPRENWKETVNNRTAQITTLEMVIGAILE